MSRKPVYTSELCVCVLACIEYVCACVRASREGEELTGSQGVCMCRDGVCEGRTWVRVCILYVLIANCRLSQG